MRYSIQPYTPDLRGQVLELQRLLWTTRDDLNDRYFRWKYEQNPYLPGPLAFLAIADGRVVGMRGVHGAHWIAGPARRPLRVACTGDNLIHPDHRGRGLFPRMGELMRAELQKVDCDYLLSTSANRVMRFLYLQDGWRTMPFVRPLSRERGPGLVAEVTQRARTRWRRVFPRKVDPFAVLDRRRPADSALSVSDEPRPAEMAALAAGLARQDAIRAAKDATFFSWRFMNPLSRYRFAYHESGGLLDGYVVLQTHVEGHGTGVNVVDWEAATPRALETLLHYVGRRCGGEPLSVWPDGAASSLDAVWRAAGFRPIADPPPQWTLPALMVRPIRADAALAVDGIDLLDLQRWSLRMVASDFY